MAMTRLGAECARDNPVELETPSTSRRAMLGGLVLAPLAISPALAADPGRVLTKNRRSNMNMHATFDAAASRDWEGTKAEFLAAKAIQDEALTRFHEREETCFRVHRDAPETTISYITKPFDNGVISMKARPGTCVLTRADYRWEHHSEPVKYLPEYHAFCAEMEAWEAAPHRVSAREAMEAAQGAVDSAHDRIAAAEQAMATFPASSIALLEEKLRMLEEDVCENDELAQVLLTAIADDLHRISQSCQLNGRIAR